MSATARDGKLEDHRYASQVRQEYPENHPVHEDGKYFKSYLVKGMFLTSTAEKLSVVRPSI